MPWQPLPRIAFAVATFPFSASVPADLPLELGDELYIIEQGGKNGEWYRGYLVAPPSLLAGLTSTKGQTLEARVFSGIFPASCVEVREVLGEDEEDVSGKENVNGQVNGDTKGPNSDSGISDGASPLNTPRTPTAKAFQLNLKTTSAGDATNGTNPTKRPKKALTNGTSAAKKRNPDAPKPQAPVPMLKIGDETPTSASEPLVDEIASCLREWHSTNLHELLLSQQYPKLDKMSSLVQTLDLSRRQLLHNVLTTHELAIHREKTVWDLVRGNKLFTGEVIVRDPTQQGRLLTGDDSAVEITKLQSMMSMLDERPHPPINETLTLHHLLIDVKAFVGTSAEATTLVFFLATKSPGTQAVPLSESYIVEVPPSGALTSIAKPGHTMRTLFTNLAAVDIGDIPGVESDLYLVVKVRSTEQVVAGKPGSRAGSRDGPVSRMRTNSGAKPPPSASAGKAGRRSVMWGQRTLSRNGTVKLNSQSEESLQESRNGHPPGTAGSKNSTEPKSGLISRIVTKTLGIGALKLNSVMKEDDEVEHLMTIWSPAIGFGDQRQDHGDEWEGVIADLIESKSDQFEKSRKAEKLQIHLKAFDSPDAEALIKATPTLLSGVMRTNKMGFSGAPTKPRSDIYFTLNEAFLPRHALLSRSSGSAIPLSSSITCANLQITLEVRRASGERIESCIFPSSNADGESSWESTAAARGESWNQTLRLAILPNDVAGAHVVMVLADVPNQPFAICYMPLWDQQAFMRDGHHSLLLYRYDDTTSTPKGTQQSRGGYLNVPWNSRGKDDVSKDEVITGPVSNLRVQTYLCSTRFSQDKVLLGLLKWKEQPPADIQDLLKRLVFVPEIEIVKLLSDVFDAIFGILVENSGNDEYEDLIFSALVTVLGIVHDRRFNLGPLVDHYAENKFKYPFATPCLVRSFTRLLAKPAEPEISRKLRATFKVVRHILKFITHARGQQKEKEADIGLTSSSSPGFNRHLRTIFKALDSLMKNTASILVGSQTLAVQHFHTWLPELEGLLSTEEILHIAIDFMDSCDAVKGKLILYKLVLVINYSHLELFSKPEQRAALSANTVRWIAPHWGKTEESVTEQWREQVRLCCSILATQVEQLGPEVPDYIPKIIDSYLAIQATPKEPNTRLSLLFPTTYPFPSKPISAEGNFDEALVELSAILSAISTMPAGMQLELAEDEMATLLEDTLHVHMSIIQCQAFPANWLSVHIYHHKSTMQTLEYLAGIMLESFLPHPDDADSYNTDLWRVFFSVLLRLVGSDALALETFPEQKRRAVWKIAGDVREQGAALLRRTWEAIGWETTADEQQRYGLSKMGGYQVQYVPVLVGPIVELCLSVHEGLRRVAVEVLQTMIASEWTMSEDLSTIQTEMIDSLDHLFKSKPLTETVRQKLFIKDLLQAFQPLSAVSDDPLYAALKELVATIEEFLELLVAVHSTDVTGQASHMIHRLRLMEFLRDMQKEEIFVRYVHQLAGLQVDARNYTEAGLALRLHADLYDWDPTRMVAPLIEPEYPSQSHFDRKERIYFEIIQHFEEGEAWSSALDAYQELQAQYEHNVYDFPKLARTQRAIATIYEKIAKSDKLTPKYFRVTYKGMGFPPSLRDREFVFEGSPNEHKLSFTDRMQEQHPSAQIVTSTGDVEDVEGQFLQISSLTPHRDLSHHVFQRARIPTVVRDYLLSIHPQVFSVTSKRNTTGPVKAHASEKILYATHEAFPTILRRSEIVKIERIQLNALQTALERVIRKTQEMVAVEKRVMDGEEDTMAPLLIEGLSILVNPTSDSCLARYRELIPTNTTEDDEDEVELSPLESGLRIALIDHAVMIKRCLAYFAKFQATLHGVKKESREELQQNFEVTFAPELASFTFPQMAQREATPTPSWAINTSPIEQHRLSLSPMGVPHSHTNGTMKTEDTAILGPSPGQATRNRLSFLARGKSAPNISKIEDPREQANGDVSQGRGVSLSSDHVPSIPIHYQEKAPGKDNRRSFFGGMNGVALPNGGGRGRIEAIDEKEDESGWMTGSDLSQREHNNMRRSSSSQRAADTTTSSTATSRVGSVRKRLSMLKLGKKASKASILVDSVAEE